MSFGKEYLLPMSARERMRGMVYFLPFLCMSLGKEYLLPMSARERM